MIHTKVLLYLIYFLYLLYMKDIELRKVQQNKKDHSLQLNLPKSFERIVNLQKGDYLQCQIMNLKNGHNVLLVEKLLTNGSTELGVTA
jgi:hypothetical protein